MKFRVSNLNVKPSQQYPYTHRVEFIVFTFEERDNVMRWIEELEVPCWVAGRQSSVLYLNTKSLSLFILKWS